MSIFINQLHIGGNLAENPEYKKFSNGREFCIFTVKTPYSVKDKDGNYSNRYEYTKCVTFINAIVKIIRNNNLLAGSPINVIGEKRTNKYTDKDNINRYKVECVVDRIQTFKDFSSNNQAANQKQVEQVEKDVEEALSIYDEPDKEENPADGIPF